MVELLAPAGDFSALNSAVNNGADSVYIGLNGFNMRINATNFTINNLKKAVDIAHNNSSKLYLCTNTIMKDKDINKFKELLPAIKQYGVDALIVSDIGMVDLAISNDLEVHISVQENVSNYRTLKTLKKLGISRAVLSRELNIEEIKKIAKNSPIETEVFIHGAMCMAISGRCFLSYGLYGKSANCGDCLQPCRKQWILNEDNNQNTNTRIINNESKNTNFLIERSKDNSYKTHFLSPKDMAMIEHIPELLKTGVDAFKIEGRARASDYVATTTKVYREAFDSYENGNYKFNPKWLDDLNNVFNRGFDTGFYFIRPYEISGSNQSPIRKKDIGQIVNYYSKIKVAELKIWDDLKLGDELLIQGQTTGSIKHKVCSMEIDNERINQVKKGNNVAIAINEKVRPNDHVYKLIEK
ncbi:peptidase U32 family protein [Methanobrevibacter filiformis]|uniref:Putative protease YdcP n=1 Tax=Methanobrevibacter filiformis TaxID=55758 RepID=A0A166A1M1_9EURY|nr:peptidase U32 family protein [Methanobrevibacter filiformis]KZX11451.1 putative protease YdcP precursor [Methanobrevibacter filiformis]